MKNWRSYAFVAALVATSLYACKAKAQDISRMELYPGMNQAVADTLAKPTGLAAYLAARKPTQDDEVPVDSPVIPCRSVRLYIGGKSHHTMENNRPNTNHEKNFALGAAFVPYCGNWIHPIVQAMHVFVNSKHGTTDMIAAGVEACLRGQLELCGTYSYAHARATDNRNRAASGKAWIPSISVGKGCYRVHYSPIAPRVTYLFLSIECFE